MSSIPPNSSSKNDQSPSAFAWLACLLSLTLFALLAAQSVFFCEDLRRQHTYSFLKISLKTGDSLNIRKYLKETLNSVGLMRYFNLIGIKADLENEKKEALINSGEVLQNISKQNYIGALTLFKNIDAAFSEQTDPQTNSAEHQLREQIHQELSLASETKQKQTEKLKALKTLELSKNEEFDKFNKSVRDLSALFAVEFQLKESEVATYKEGMLQGLPLIGLKDNIADFEELKSELLKINSNTLQDDSQKTVQVLLDKFEEIRTSTFPVLIEIESLQQRESELRTSLQEISARLEELNKSSSSKLESLILENIPKMDSNLV